jgi:DsbC/DsbD-like thiol-disulfide interchange protein
MRFALLSLFAFAAIPTFSLGQSFDNLAQARVLTGWREDATTHIAAVEITLEPGWVTYWRSPGTSGIPPEFVFSGSPAIVSITPLWPTPTVFGEPGFLSIGYYDSVVVPMVVRLSDPTAKVALSGDMTIGVCEEICIPVTLSFDAQLPMVGAANTAISDALANRPVTQLAANVGTVTCRIDQIADGLRMTTDINVAPTGAQEHVVIEASDPRVWVSEAQTTRSGSTLQATVDLVHPSGQPFAFDRGSVRITVLGTDTAIDINGCAAG